MLRNINLNRNPSWDGAMKAITNSTYPISAAVPAAELIAGYARHDQLLKRKGWVTVAGLALSGVVSYGLKYGIDRTPPYITYPYLQSYEHGNDPSFPSGHTTFAFYTATMLSINYPRWYVIAPSYLWAAGVGYSRMYLGVHYPSDVLAGAIVGAGSAWLAYHGNKWLQHRKKKATPSAK